MQIRIGRLRGIIDKSGIPYLRAGSAAIRRRTAIQIVLNINRRSDRVAGGIIHEDVVDQVAIRERIRRVHPDTHEIVTDECVIGYNMISQRVTRLVRRIIDRSSGACDSRISDLKKVVIDPQMRLTATCIVRVNVRFTRVEERVTEDTGVVAISLYEVLMLGSNIGAVGRPGRDSCEIISIYIYAPSPLDAVITISARTVQVSVWSP